MGKKEFLAQEYSVAKGGKNIKEGTKTGRTGTILVGTFFCFSLVISISLIAFTIVFFFSRVEGSSMMATLNPDYTTVHSANTDSVLVNRRSSPRRGDIIVVRYYRPTGNHNDGRGNFDFFIKRLIAMNGDTVYFNRIPLDEPTAGGQHYRFEIQVNGIAIDESYLDPYWGQNVTYQRVWNYLYVNRYASRFAYFIRPVTYPNGIIRNEIHVPRGYMFYMGDNRGGSGTREDLELKSYDSSFFGPMPMSTLVGVVVDIVPNTRSLPAYFWQQFVHFITFRWVSQR